VANESGELGRRVPRNSDANKFASCGSNSVMQEGCSVRASGIASVGWPVLNGRSDAAQLVFAVKEADDTDVQLSQRYQYRK
jgi:hypothetical protein